MLTVYETLEEVEIASYVYFFIFGGYLIVAGTTGTYLRYYIYFYSNLLDTVTELGFSPG